MIDEQNNLISVIFLIPQDSVFAGEAKTRRALETLMNQSYENVEIIIVNSVPEFVDLLEEFTSTECSRSITLVEKYEASGPELMFAGLSKAKGEYVCWIENNDMLSSHALEMHMTYASKHSADISIIDYTNPPDTEDRLTVLSHKDSMVKRLVLNKLTCRIYGNIYRRVFFYNLQTADIFENFFELSLKLAMLQNRTVVMYRNDLYLPHPEYGASGEHEELELLEKKAADIAERYKSYIKKGLIEDKNLELSTDMIRLALELYIKSYKEYPEIAEHSVKILKIRATSKYDWDNLLRRLILQDSVFKRVAITAYEISGTNRNI